jgi:hypothetical protein
VIVRDVEKRTEHVQVTQALDQRTAPLPAISFPVTTLA